MTRLVVFDVDGTLVDSQHVIVAAMAEAFDGTGHALPERARLLSVVGLSLNEAMAALAPHLPEAETVWLADRYRDSFVARRASAPVSARAACSIDGCGFDGWPSAVWVVAKRCPIGKQAKRWSSPRRFIRGPSARRATKLSR